MMDDFRRWSEALVGGLGGDLDLERSRAEIGEMFLFFSDVVERRRREPGEDLISAIAVAEPDGRQLEPIEVVMFCILLLVAGNETTTKLIGNHQEALWDHPDQAALLRERPELVDAAIEEAFRYCGTVQGLVRRTTQACAIGESDYPPTPMSSCCSPQRTATRPCSATPTGTGWNARTSITSPSVTASTTAWARSSPDSRCGPCSKRSFAQELISSPPGHRDAR